METWTLPRLGREYYRVQITTDPVINEWEISFDHGVTWFLLEPDGATGYSKILVAGPAYVQPVGDVAEYVELDSSVVPYVRAQDSPEVIIRTTPKIELV